MLIGLISDTHDQQERTRRAVAALLAANVEAIIHSGDFLGPSIVEICSVRPLYFVYGNNDSPSDLLPMALECGATSLEWGGMIELAGKKVAVTHGHMTKDINRLLNMKPDFLITGHSHIKHDYIAGVTNRINPGALHRAEVFSVATLNLLTGQVSFLPIAR